MNLSTKITLSRLVLAGIILLLLLFPWIDIGFSFKTFVIKGRIIIDTKYIIAGVLFLIASITDVLDGYFARKEKKESEVGSALDIMADKFLINGVLIVLAYQGFIHVLIPVIIVVRDILLDGLRLLAAKEQKEITENKLGKIKTICLLLGTTLILFYNLPFEIWGIYLAEIIIDIGAILSVISGISYFIELKNKLKVEELKF